MMQPRSDQPVRRQTTLTPVKAVGYGVGGILSVAMLGGAAMAAFHVAATAVTVGASAVALLAAGILSPAIIQGLKTARVKVRETTARALPIETLIQQRQEFENVINDKAQQLAQAHGYLQDMRRQIDQNRTDMDAAQLSTWEHDLQVSTEALAQADGRLGELREQAREFDRQIKKARIDLQLSQTKGQIARSMNQAQLSAEERHASESALSEISRRMGQSQAALEQALSQNVMGRA